MSELYLSGTGFIESLFLPLLYLLGQVVTLIPTDLTGVFDGVTLVMSWVALLHNTDIFPLYLILTFDIFLFSGFVSLVMRLLRWIIDVIPFV